LFVETRLLLSRAILHDDRLFPDPLTFKPERFTDPNVDPRVPAAVDYAFGFGRRVCPGRWMAYSFIWIVTASVLSAYRIEKAVRDGRVVEPTGAYSPGILACVAVLLLWPGRLDTFAEINPTFFDSFTYI
jgi:cytochrome P450